jgi:arylsulfatase A-like enzyme
MLSLVLTFVLIACGGSDSTSVSAIGTSTAFPDLSTRTATHAIPLHKTPGSYVLGESGIERSAAESHFLDMEEIPNAKNVRRKLKVVRGTVPFLTGSGQQRFRPTGMSVFVDGTEVPFARGKAADADESTWRVVGKNVVMSHPTLPKKGAVEVRMRASTAVLDRHDPVQSGKSPDEFVHYDVTLKGQTRHGLLLPAPGSATWDLSLPESKKITLSSWLMLEESPVNTPATDGADVAVVVTANSVETEVAVHPLEPGPPGFEKWTVDLSAYAGQRVTLSLQTRPRANNHFDWVFLGSPTITGTPSGGVKRVVVVAMDTTRPDHFGFSGYERNTTPDMDRIASQSVVFTRAWSTAPRTRPSFRSATTGRYPLKAVGAKNLGEVFQDNGFATAGIVANVHLQPRFDFDHGFDWWRYSGKSNANDQVDLALDWLKDHSDRDTFLFLHFMDAHLPYRAPGEWKNKFVGQEDPSLPGQYNRWEVNKWSKKGEMSPVRKAHIESLHDGEMAFMSHHLGRFFDELDKLDGETVAIIHSDHGEEFWEHGGYEHNHTLYDEVTRTVLWIRPKGGLAEGLKMEQPATLMDLAPTLYDMMGWTDVPDSEGRSLVPLLDGDDDGDWTRPLPIAFVQYDKERWAVIFDEKKYILHTGSGWEELYDLNADSDEKKNLARNKALDLQPWREALAAAHDIPVRPGYRIRVTVPVDSAPVEIALPAPALGADILEPEATMARRANLEWGEPPKKTAAEVGQVTLADDKLSLIFTPGTAPTGIIWVQLEDAHPASGVTLKREGSTLTLAEAKNGTSRYKEPQNAIVVDPGTILVPPPGEAALMKALAAVNGDDLTADAEALKLLEELGYIH